MTADSTATTRRTILGAGLLAIPAAVTAATIATPAPVPATGISPELARLIAEHDAAERTNTEAEDVFEQVAKVCKVEAATIPHVEVEMGPNFTGETIVWTTANTGHVGAARNALQSLDRKAEFTQRCRKLVAAHLRRERAVQRLRKGHDYDAAWDRMEATGDVWIASINAVVTFPARSFVDLATIVAFAAKSDSLEDASVNLATSAARLLGQEA